MSAMNTRFALWAVTFNAIAVLAAAWGFQLIGGYLPCPLCLQQRWAWYATVVIAVVVAVSARGKPALMRAGLALMGLVLIVGAGLAGYHAGVEWGFWPGPDSCAGGGGLSGGLPDLDAVQVVRCDEVQWRFLGLSFAGWNALLSAWTAGVAITGALSKRT